MDLSIDTNKITNNMGVTSTYATSISPILSTTSNSYTSYIYSWIIKTNNVTLNQLFARFVYFVQNNLKVVFERIKGI